MAKKRFLDKFGLEHYHNLILSIFTGRNIYKKRVAITSGSTITSLTFDPDGYTYSSGDENLLDVYLNGLRLDSTEYTAAYANDAVTITLATTVTGGGSDAIEAVLRK